MNEQRNSLKGAASILAAAALLGTGLIGCDVEEPSPEVEESDENTEALGGPSKLGLCNQGMGTAIVEIDPAASKRCQVSDLMELVTNQCANYPEVCNFLNWVNSVNGEIQCTSYIDHGVTKHCADVVDRYQSGVLIEEHLGNPKNFFVAYATDVPTHPDFIKWQDALARPDFTDVPVELSVTGYVPEHIGPPVATHIPPSPWDRDERILKFDPRMCPDCGYTYAGPNYDEISFPADLVTYSWTPHFSGFGTRTGDCEFEYERGGTMLTLDPTACADEESYRFTGRW